MTSHAALRTMLRLTLSTPILLLALVPPALAATLITVPPDQPTGVTLNGSDALVVNSGGTVTNTAGNVAVTGTHARSIEVNAGGHITGAALASAVDLTDGLFDFSNDGTVTGLGTFGAAVRVRSGTVRAFENTGTMSTTNFNALYFNNQNIGENVNVGTFRNSGSITAPSDDTVLIDGTVSEFSNFEGGRIINTGEGGVFIGGLVSDFSNEGEISGLESAIIFKGGVTDAFNSGDLISTGTGTDAAVDIRGTGVSTVFDNAGTISGANGVLFAADSGSATFTNRATIEATAPGGTALRLTQNDDTLTLWGTSEITGIVDGGDGTDGLELAQVFGGTFAMDQVGANKQFRSFESFSKTSIGDWDFTGDSTETLFWDVLGTGTITVNGDLPNTRFVMNAGTLKGHGTVGDVEVDAGASIAPGNSVGTITTQDIAFNAGSTYEVEVSGATADKIVVRGTANLTGGTVMVSGNSASCATQQFEILTAVNPIATSFAGLTSSIGGASLSYGPNSVFLNLTGSGGRTFTGFGTTRNQEATAVALDALGCTGQPYAAQLAALTDVQVPEALEALSGAGHAEIAATQIETAGQIGHAMSDRLQQAFDTVDSSVVPNGFAAGGKSLLDPGGIDGLSVWGTGYGAKLSRAGGTDGVASGVVFGVDGKVSEDWRLGMMGGLGIDSIDAGATSGTSVDASFGGYAGAQIGIIKIKAGAAYTRHLIEASRAFIFPGVNDTMTAAYQAGTAQAFVDVSTDFDTGKVTLSPFARIEGVSHSTDAFTETGGAGALSTAASVSNALFVTLGLGARTEFVLNDTMLVTAHGSVGWRHAFADLPVIANSFAGGGPFTIAAAPIAGDVAVITAGASVDVNENVSLDLSYEGTYGSGQSSNAVKLTLIGKF